MLSLLAYPEHPCWAPLHDGPTHPNQVALALTTCTRAGRREVEQWQEGQGEFTCIRGCGAWLCAGDSPQDNMSDFHGFGVLESTMKDGASSPPGGRAAVAISKGGLCCRSAGPAREAG